MDFAGITCSLYISAAGPWGSTIKTEFARQQQTWHRNSPYKENVTKDVLKDMLQDNNQQ